MLAKEANRSTVWAPHRPLMCRKTRGANCQSELSEMRERLSAYTFAALRMYKVLILMS